MTHQSSQVGNQNQLHQFWTTIQISKWTFGICHFISRDFLGLTRMTCLGRAMIFLLVPCFRCWKLTSFISISSNLSSIRSNSQKIFPISPDEQIQWHLDFPATLPFNPHTQPPSVSHPPLLPKEIQKRYLPLFFLSRPDFWFLMMFLLSLLSFWRSWTLGNLTLLVQVIGGSCPTISFSSGLR